MNFSIDRLITLALKRRYIVVALALLLLAGGFVAFKTLSLEAYPDFTDPRVRVITLLPGKGAEEVERLVTIPLEKELNGIPGETNLRSQSIFGLSVVIITFADGTPSQLARQQVLERVAQADLPDSAKPELDPDASAIGEIYRYTLESDYYDPLTLKATQDWQLEKLFRQIPGVIDVTSFGGPTKTYRVNVDPGRLKAYNLSVTQVYEAISRSNATTGGNYIENNGQAYIVRGLGLLKNADDLGDVVVSAADDGTPIRVRDVSHIDVGPGVRLGQVGKNRDDDVVQGIVLMRRGEDPSAVIERLYEKFPDIQAALPHGIKLVPLYDRTELIRRTLDTIGHNVAEGIVLVVVVLLLFLFEVRSALIAATVIPLALLFAFVLLNVFRIPANLLSLGAVDFGIIVDGTVVMVENIYRRLAHEGHDLQPIDRVQLTLEAAKDVGKPILFATTIIVTAFLPIFAFDGVAGKLFRPLAFTMNFALLGAVLVSLTVIPVLCSFVLTRKPLIERESPILYLAEKIYRPLLTAAVRAPWALLGGCAAAFGAAVLLFGSVGSEFLPNLDEGNIWLRVTVLPTSVSLEQSVKVAQAIRLRLIRFGEVKNVVSQVGSPDDGTDANNPSNIEFLVDLKPAEQWNPKWHQNKEELVEAMDRNLQNVPGILTTFSQYIQDNVDEAIAGAKGEVAVKLYGPDLSVLQKYGDQIAAIMTKIPGMVDVADDKMLGQPQYQIQVDRRSADRYGVNVEDIEQVIETAVGGTVATQLVEGERKFNVLVRFDRPFRSSPDALANILITAPNGRTVPLAAVAKVETTVGATMIGRSENSRLILVKANVRNRDLGGAVAEAQQKVNAQVKLPEGYHLVWGGQFENQQRANARLSIAIPITLGVIFLILYSSFGTVRDALIAMTAIPLAAIGGVSGLWLTHTYFSVSAGVGFIAAAGVSVQNSVIILTYIRQLRQEGFPTMKAVFEGAQTRLRPVLMAGTVAILGLIPAALSNGIGSQSQKPFAIVIIGGLLTATLLTVFVVPVLYGLLEDKKLLNAEL
ncbi:efflux RND transporter permease subunit [Gloeobacter kilaueensis]|uniref:Heavy metal efflux pump, CzcA family n=1 Tax=Gloeobacter kilaueensis (strain ATCC BAA-2537 / CCAP 1431/1 / ULC 316 / JS1) TaxID=1183438 RepID=U5QR08_GLOK1|nr:CusA/CzcA family heavy metal efflux RND transporter [Gloeobacter kilaueensis]AGY60089.1 heavy metal efflux pump, CzcA family [Gloeobacter kilaueensis JS1]